MSEENTPSRPRRRTKKKVSKKATKKVAQTEHRISVAEPFDEHNAPDICRTWVRRDPLAAYMGVNNTPPNDVMVRAFYTAQVVLQPMINAGYQFAVISWFRVESVEKIWQTQRFINWCRDRGKPSNEDTWAEYYEGCLHRLGWAVDVAFTDPKAAVACVEDINGNVIVRGGSAQIIGGNDSSTVVEVCLVTFDEMMPREGQ